MADQHSGLLWGQVLSLSKILFSRRFKPESVDTFLRAVPKVIISEVSMLQLIFSFLNVRYLLEQVFEVYLSWTNLYIHTDMHGCSLPLKTGFVSQLLTPGNIQIALQPEG